MVDSTQYPVGTPGKKWQAQEKQQWLLNQSVKRSYQQQVVDKLAALESDFDLIQYGQLPYNNSSYSLYALKHKNWHANKPVVVVTGGVHGYETSGVQGAIRFAQSKANEYCDKFNLLVLPCISPWGYETINRWNPDAIDPNRSFYEQSPASESRLVMEFINTITEHVVLHIDLHETTDTDNSEFRPALAARDASVHDNWNIPDGFYLVGDSTKPEPEFQKAIIDSVKRVTHIAPADENDKLIGVPLEQFGVINYQAKKLGLCMGLTNADYVTTTEVYPDSPLVDDENCILAQVAAITGAIEFIL